MSSVPEVSCVLPTRGRRRWVALALAWFARQDYAARELVVVDDGPERVDDLVGEVAGARYVWLAGDNSVGAKLNVGIEAARGELVAIWNDDDWYAPWRLSYQVEELRSRGAELCGVDRLLFCDVRDGQLWRYRWAPGGGYAATPQYLIGGTLLFERGYWWERQYPDLMVGEDNAFIKGRLDRALNLATDAFYVAMLHGGNTSPKLVGVGDQWARAAGRLADFIPGPDAWRICPAEPTGRPPVAPTTDNVRYGLR